MALAIRLGSNKHIAQAISARSPVAAINTIITLPTIRTVIDFDEFPKMEIEQTLRYYDNYVKYPIRLVCKFRASTF